MSQVLEWRKERKCYRSQPWNRGKAGSVADYGNGTEERMKVLEIAAWSRGTTGSGADYSDGAAERMKVLEIAAWSRGKDVNTVDYCPKGPRVE